MAALAYANPPYQTANCPDARKLAVPRPGASELEQRFVERARGWLRDLQPEWTCVYGHVGQLPCPAAAPDCRPVGGLQFHVWRRKDCSEGVIAFRGSDRGDLGDWLSNFRPFLRLLPIADEYEQVSLHAREIVTRATCAGRATPVVAVGHSLGGGLAQQASYNDERIRYVYGFDPSPITGFFDVALPQRTRALQNLGIDRVYESGEILSSPRYLIGGILNPRACNPRVRLVRFNTEPLGRPAAQHDISKLTLNFAKLAPAGHKSRADPRRDAVQCSDEPDKLRT
jgi:hypothetical protein